MENHHEDNELKAIGIRNGERGVGGENGTISPDGF